MHGFSKLEHWHLTVDTERIHSRKADFYYFLIFFKSIFTTFITLEYNKIKFMHSKCIAGVSLVDVGESIMVQSLLKTAKSFSNQCTYDGQIVDWTGDPIRPAISRDRARA